MGGRKNFFNTKKKVIFKLLRFFFVFNIKKYKILFGY